MAERDDLPNGHLLWTPQQLHERLDDDHLVVLDVRPSHLVLDGAVPGAVHFDLYGIGLTKTPPALWEEYVHLMRSLLGMRGCALDRTVCVYEEQSGIRAARAFWWLEYFGHTDVHVLDGGIQAWRAAGLPVVRELAEPHPRGIRPEFRHEAFISADDLHASLERDDLCVLDTRDDGEHAGTRRRAARGGTIPGAIHLEWVHYLDEAGRFKPGEELAALFERAGITRDKAVVPF